jgi:hypothetical protein
MPLPVASFAMTLQVNVEVRPRRPWARCAIISDLRLLEGGIDEMLHESCLLDLDAR